MVRGASPAAAPAPAAAPQTALPPTCRCTPVRLVSFGGSICILDWHLACLLGNKPVCPGKICWPRMRGCACRDARLDQQRAELAQRRAALVPIHEGQLQDQVACTAEVGRDTVLTVCSVGGPNLDNA